MVYRTRNITSAACRADEQFRIAFGEIEIIQVERRWLHACVREWRRLSETPEMAADVFRRRLAFLRVLVRFVRDRAREERSIAAIMAL